MTVVKIGVDAHKRTHTLVAADEVGRRVATKTVPATTVRHLAALEWAGQFAERSWALEDCRHLTPAARRRPATRRRDRRAGADGVDGQRPA